MYDVIHGSGKGWRLVLRAVQLNHRADVPFSGEYMIMQDRSVASGRSLSSSGLFLGHCTTLPRQSLDPGQAQSYSQDDGRS